MIGQNIVISLTNLSDFQKYVVGYEYTSNEILTDGQYTFDSSQRAFRAKKASGISNKINISFLQLGVSQLFAGDAIEIELQCKNINGDKFRIGIDGYSGNEETYISTNNNEWETMYIKHIVRDDVYSTHPGTQIAFGLWTDYTGEFSVRDIVVKITTKAAISSISIVEQGLNANGSYVKYSDGRMECWGTATFTELALATAWGSIFTCSSPQTITYPATFTSVESYSLTNVTVDGSAWIRGNGFENNSASFYFDRAVSTPAMNYRVAFIVIGRWS